MNISSVARAGLVSETRRPEAVQDTTQNSNDTASIAQAVQQQAAASRDAQVTRAPEQTAALRFAAVLNTTAGTETVAEEEAASSGAEQNLLAKSVVARNNATLQQQIAERVRQIYEFG